MYSISQSEDPLRRDDEKNAPGILIVSGDRIQGHGRIFMFGGHFGYARSYRQLGSAEAMTSEFHKIWPSHADHAARMKDEFDMYYADRGYRVFQRCGEHP